MVNSFTFTLALCDSLLSTMCGSTKPLNLKHYNGYTPKGDVALTTKLFSKEIALSNEAVEKIGMCYPNEDVGCVICRIILEKTFQVSSNQPV